MESRSTFREKVTDEAWQYKIRKQKETDFIKSGKYKFWDYIDLSLKNATVREVERITAEKIIKEYEWLGDMAVTNLYYGIFFDIYCGGVICINTNGVFVGNGRMYGLNDNVVSYFARGACQFWTPNGSASKLLSIALKMEKKRGAKVAHAFSDTNAGEYGTVYQATNWICLGKQSGYDYEMYKNGKCIHSRLLKNHAKTRKITINEYIRILQNNGWVKQDVNKKYRYCYILADEPLKTMIQKKIGHLITEYPKRPLSGKVELNASFGLDAQCATVTPLPQGKDTTENEKVNR
jgi:hypothetical protein